MGLHFWGGAGGGEGGHPRPWPDVLVSRVVCNS